MRACSSMMDSAGTTVRPCADAVAQDADALDLELDDVARLDPAVELEPAAAADGAAAEDVAGHERSAPGTWAMTSGKLKSIAPSVARRPGLAVHARRHRARSRVELVRRRRGTGPIELAKSLPRPGPRPTSISRNWMSRALQSLKIV